MISGCTARHKQSKKSAASSKNMRNRRTAVRTLKPMDMYPRGVILETDSSISGIDPYRRWCPIAPQNPPVPRHFAIRPADLRPLSPITLRQTLSTSDACRIALCRKTSHTGNESGRSPNIQRMDRMTLSAWSGKCSDQETSVSRKKLIRRLELPSVPYVLSMIPG